MEYQGKYYYKIQWSCGYSGTGDYEVIESEQPMTDEELSDLAKERWLESCGEYSHGEPDEDEMIESEFMENPDGE